MSKKNLFSRQTIGHLDSHFLDKKFKIRNLLIFTNDLISVFLMILVVKLADDFFVFFFPKFT